MGITGAEARELLKKSGRSKYGVDTSAAGRDKRTYNGIVYHSQAECKYAQALDIRVRIGELKSWTRQIPYPLIVNGQKICTYTADFRLLFPNFTTEVVEVKGALTSEARIKMALFRALYPTATLRVIKSKEV